ncbi:hypothetical protein HDU89_004155 [Geranomyces variabilis]|nr:hypothetical protein HDU89_004155 [Geranomyces variabilis]
MPTKGKHAKTKGRKQKLKQCDQAGDKQCDESGIPFSDYGDAVERAIRRDRVNLARKILRNKTIPHTYEDFNMREFSKTASFVHQPNTVNNNMTNKDIMQAYDADIYQYIKVDTEIPSEKIAVGLDAAGERLYVYFRGFAKFRHIHGHLDKAITTLIATYPPAEPQTDECHVAFPGQPDIHGTHHIGFGDLQTQPGEKEAWTLQISSGSIGKGDANCAAFKKQRYALKNYWSSNPFQVAFSMIVIVINEFVTKHRDLKDKPDGWCAIVCLGDFQGSKFCLPQLKTRIPFVPGDILFIRSCALEHMGQKWTGDHRYSVVFKMPNLAWTLLLAARQSEDGATAKRNLDEFSNRILGSCSNPSRRVDINPPERKQAADDLFCKGYIVYIFTPFVPSFV